MGHTWISKREISGFGGGYEEQCRAMVIRGFNWFEENPDAEPHFQGVKGMYGIIEENNEDAEVLVTAMLGEDNVGATGAMVQATVGHVMAAKRHGWSWEEYQAELDKSEE